MTEHELEQAMAEMRDLLDDPEAAEKFWKKMGRLGREFITERWGRLPVCPFLEAGPFEPAEDPLIAVDLSPAAEETIEVHWKVKYEED